MSSEIASMFDMLAASHDTFGIRHAQCSRGTPSTAPESHGDDLAKTAPKTALKKQPPKNGQSEGQPQLLVPRRLSHRRRRMPARLRSVALIEFDSEPVHRDRRSAQRR